MREKKRLEELTEAIYRVSPEALEAFNDHRAVIIEKTVKASMKHVDDVSHHGIHAARIIASGMEFTLKMLEPAMSFGELAILEDEIAWAADRLPHDGVLPKHLVSRFEILKGVINDVMQPAHARQIVPYIEWMGVKIAAGGENQQKTDADS